MQEALRLEKQEPGPEQSVKQFWSCFTNARRDTAEASNQQILAAVTSDNCGCFIRDLGIECDQAE